MFTPILFSLPSRSLLVVRSSLFPLPSAPVDFDSRSCPITGLQVKLTPVPRESCGSRGTCGNSRKMSLSSVVLHLTKMFSHRPVSWLSLLIGCCTERMQFWIYKPRGFN